MSISLVSLFNHSHPVSHPYMSLTLRFCPQDAPLYSSSLQWSLFNNCSPLLHWSISHMDSYPGLALCLICAPQFQLWDLTSLHAALHLDRPSVSNLSVQGDVKYA